MKRFVRRLCWTVLATLLFAGLSAAVEPPAVGGQLPAFTLPVPDNPEHRNYLGLTGERKDFAVPEVADPVAIIEILSMYCPHCQREAPTVNRLYELIQSSPDLKGKIKLVGIAVGNTPFEVDHFRETYNIPFPLFPDPDFAIHTLVGEVRTPFFMVVQKEQEGGHRVIYSALGAFGKPEAFLDLILRKSELQ